MKRLFCIILAALFLLCGCGEEGAGSSSAGSYVSPFNDPDYRSAKELLAALDGDDPTVGKYASCYIESTDSNIDVTKQTLRSGPRIRIVLPREIKVVSGDTVIFKIASLEKEDQDGMIKWYVKADDSAEGENIKVISAYPAEESVDPNAKTEGKMVKFYEIALDLPKNTVEGSKDAGKTKTFSFDDKYFEITETYGRNDFHSDAMIASLQSTYKDFIQVTYLFFVNNSPAIYYEVKDVGHYDALILFSVKEYSYALGLTTETQTPESVRSFADDFLFHILEINHVAPDLKPTTGNGYVRFTTAIPEHIRNDPRSSNFKGSSYFVTNSIAMDFLGLSGSNSSPDILFSLINRSSTDLYVNIESLVVNNKPIRALISSNDLAPNGTCYGYISLFGLDDIGLTSKDIKTIKIRFRLTNKQNWQNLPSNDITISLET